MTLQLVKPDKNWYSAYQSFYFEWDESKEKMIPWVIAQFPDDIDKLLAFYDDHHSGNIPQNWVPDTTYWLVDEANVIGVVNIRHYLNDFLLESGGHIGYGIRPSERRKGYATIMLQLALKKAKELGIKETLVTCDAENVASKKVILRNGGKAADDYVDNDGNIIHRFWIDA
ncbi:GNAT family N-acetyltransferase [Gracilibacillus salinarum]|uniref:GNAT family N-acetyltransferase n=1 Tax=Gracilibacillus salinarum TaxID=2932255 RepID=A0ABY4GR61_9BACI|nr:GNAT family N-acetyltransferase [Gracilibacillus salinarum]UOQ86625.1 GNAT family N-acetyltransferase [Gracilibacillus salinarum]